MEVSKMCLYSTFQEQSSHSASYLRGVKFIKTTKPVHFVVVTDIRPCYFTEPASLEYLKWQLSLIGPPCRIVCWLCEHDRKPGENNKLSSYAAVWDWTPAAGRKFKGWKSLLDKNYIYLELTRRHAVSCEDFWIEKNYEWGMVAYSVGYGHFIPIIGPDKKKIPKSGGFVEGFPGLKRVWTTESQPRASACLRLTDENRCPHTETEKPTLRSNHAQPAAQNKQTCM